MKVTELSALAIWPTYCPFEADAAVLMLASTMAACSASKSWTRSSVYGPSGPANRRASVRYCQAVEYVASGSSKAQGVKPIASRQVVRVPAMPTWWDPLLYKCMKNCRCGSHKSR